MTQENKQLLLKDLCARLPYGVKVLHDGNVKEVQYVEPLYNEIKLLEDFSNYTVDICEVKPYLRPMSSMTEEESTTYEYSFLYSNDLRIYAEEYIDWLNAHHFDYRGLIERDLALEAPEGMYKID